MSASEKNTG